MDEYSPDEMVLIKHFGFTDIMTNVDPVGLFRLMAMHAFKSGEQSLYVDALRRCMIALDACKPYRMTPEFDRLAAVTVAQKEVW